jgi:hypothetical protein
MTNKNYIWERFVIFIKQNEYKEISSNLLEWDSSQEFLHGCDSHLTDIYELLITEWFFGGCFEGVIKLRGP